MTTLTPHIIDMSKAINAIHKEYGRQLYHEPEAVEKLATLWGFKSNPHGVVIDYATQKILRVKACRGDIHFAESSKGYWLIGLNASTSMSGFCYAPSVFHDTGFASYEDARLAGILSLEKFFIRELDSQSSSNAAKETSRSVIKILEKAKHPQLNLFGTASTIGGSRGR